MKNIAAILRKPILTEKMLKMQESQHSYAFLVDKNATKIDIRRAVQQKFDVTVEQVRTVLVKGKTKRMNSRRGISTGKRPDWKKAIVTIRKGDSIDFFEK